MLQRSLLRLRGSAAAFTTRLGQPGSGCFSRSSNKAAAAAACRQRPQQARGMTSAASAAGAAAAARGNGGRRIIRGVAFDMDGTLTVPVIDFAYMRQRAGVGPTGDILDIISKWPEGEQARARAAIAEVEAQALKDMQAMPGLLELCELLDASGVPRGLITRNVLSSVAFFHEHHLPLPPFVPAISRECQFPYKPSPVALLHICDTWGVVPSEVVMIGDSAKDDVVCGNRAGAVSVLLDTEGRYDGIDDPSLAGECRPAALVRSLAEFQQLLLSEWQLLPPPGLAEQERQLGRQQQQAQAGLM